MVVAALLLASTMQAAAQGEGGAEGVCAEYALVPLPAAAEVATPKSFPGCASYKWYRGIGRRVSATPKDELEDGAVSAEGLAKAQAVWERYRRAWDAFARLRYPEEAQRIEAEIDLERYRWLKTMDRD